MEEPRKIGPVALGGIPRLVAILEKAHPLGFVSDLQKKGASILEIRLDSFPSPEEGLEFLELLSREKGIRERFGLLATHRENETNRGKRIPVFERAALFADALDIEYECKERRDLVTLAKKSNCLSILSTHDFEKTPKEQELQAVLEEAEGLGADLSKIAVFAQSLDDLRRLLCFTEQNKARGLIAIAMGKYGLFSRLAAPFFGSLLSYGFVTKANAPGQLPIEELHENFLKFYPGYTGSSFSAAS